MLFKSTDSLLGRQREKDRGGEGGTPIRIPITTKQDFGSIASHRNLSS
jgi:hypothetical protein